MIKTEAKRMLMIITTEGINLTNAAESRSITTSYIHNMDRLPHKKSVVKEP